MTMNRIIIIGAGQAGLQTATSLRTLGYEGSLMLIGEEAYPPYQRPPLSKAYLKGELVRERLWLKPPAFYEKHSIRLQTGLRVQSLDRLQKRVVFTKGESEPYDRVVLATGARARRLSAPGADLEGVQTLRGLDDADQLRTALEQKQGPIALVGGGYIGLEIAAAVRSLGRQVHVFEAAPRLLARTASHAMADFFHKLHTQYGVVFHFGAEVKAFQGKQDLEALICLHQASTSQRHHDTGLALICIGAEPCDHLARAAGLACDHGIITDAYGRTDDPCVFALGDVASITDHPLGRVRLESVPHAIEQGKRVAAAILGRPVPPFQTPWFWSDQYEVKLQMAGLPLQADETLDFSPSQAGKANHETGFFHFRDKRLIACETANAPRLFMSARQALDAGAMITPEDLRKTSDPVEGLMQAARQAKALKD